MTENKIKEYDINIKIVGEDSNAFAILGRCRKAMKYAGCTTAEIDAFVKEATSQDYHHLIMTVLGTFKSDGGSSDE